MTNVSVWPKTGAEEAALAREVARTVFLCGEFDDLEHALGLHPASQDVLDAEHDEVHAWLERVGPLAPVLLQVAELTGTLLARGLPLQSGAVSGIDPQVLDALCCRSAYEGLVAGLNILSKNGMLALPRFA